jgi:hypothetical protein
MATHRVPFAFSNPENCVAKVQSFGDIFYVGVCRKMFLENFLLQVYIRSSAKEKILLMFAEKVDQKEPTNVFIM